MNDKDPAYLAWLAQGMNAELGKFAVTPLAFAAGYLAGSASNQDTQLLDWMQEHLKRDGEMHLPDGSCKTVNAWAVAADGEDLRAALRAARDQAMKGLN